MLKIEQKRRSLASGSPTQPLEAGAAGRLAAQQRECLRQEQGGILSSTMLQNSLDTISAGKKLVQKQQTNKGKQVKVKTLVKIS